MKRILDRIIDLFLCLILLGMTLVVFIQVFFRYVLQAPLPWPEETARIMLVWLSFLGAYMALRENKHISFSLVIDRLPHSVQAVSQVVAQVCVVLFLLVVVKEGFAFTERFAYVPMPYTGVSTGWVAYSVLPLSGLLMLLQSVIELSQTIAQVRQGAPPSDKGVMSS